jgi:hypothetical protein
MNNILDKIALEEQTDKSSSYHNYAVKYDYYFNNIKDNKLKILEIGVLNGSSLKMWNKYFTNSEIDAIDIDPNCKIYEKQNTKIFIGDQSDISFLEKNFGGNEYDIIIDDGSHIPKHQITSFEFFFSKLTPGGFYVIEDLHTSYCPHPKFSTDKINFVDYLKEKVNDLQLNGKDAIEWSYGDKKNHLNAVGWEKLNSYNYYEKYIEFIHFYKSICFIKKEIW